MYTVLSIIIILVCLLLTLVVLIQNPKGGGIASNFSAPSQIMGVKRSSDFIEKATWILAIALIVFSLSSNFLRPGANTEADAPESRIGGQLENVPATAPAAAPAPAQQAQPTQDAATPAAEPAAEPAK